MSIYTEIVALEDRKNIFDSILQEKNMNLENRYKIEILKEDMTNILSNIFSVYSASVISNSFYLQVNNIESSIYNLISQKNKELSQANKELESLQTTNKKILFSLYALKFTKENIDVSSNIEKRLLDMKNNILNININRKRKYALRFIEDKLLTYTHNLKRLTQIVYDTKEKSFLPFEKRQEIYDIFCSISLSNQYDKNHTKMFNEDSNFCDIYMTDYIKWYENIFLENCDSIGLNLKSYSSYLSNCILTQEFSIEAILSYIDEFIEKKYSAEIKNYSKAIEEFIQKSKKEIKLQLKACFTFKNSDVILGLTEDIKKEIIPTYLLNIENKEFVSHILLNNKFILKKDIIIQNIQDDLLKYILKNFNSDDYLVSYYAYQNQKNNQIKGFLDYYASLLEKSKNMLMESYIDRINKIVKTEVEKNNKYKKVEEKYNTLNKEIEELNEALLYINTNYREFNNENFKVYLQGVEKMYSVKNLYNIISSKSSNLFYKLKAKKIIKRELPCIKAFINNDDLKKNIKNEIIVSILRSPNLIEKLQES